MRLLRLQIRASGMVSRIRSASCLCILGKRTYRSAGGLLETLTKEIIMNSVTSACRVFKG